MSLNERQFVCEVCGFTEDRDLNASYNIEDFAVNTLRSKGIKACGESVRPYRQCIGDKAVSMMQETSLSGS